MEQRVFTAMASGGQSVLTAGTRPRVRTVPMLVPITSAPVRLTVTTVWYVGAFFQGFFPTLCFSGNALAAAARLRRR